MLETLLSELEPVVLDEQKFVVRFLHLQSSAWEKAFNEQVGCADALIYDAKIKSVLQSNATFVT